MTKSLKKTLKKAQIFLGKPHKKIAERFKYYLDFFGGSKVAQVSPKELPQTEKIQILKHKKITWVDIKDPGRREISTLAEKYPFHPLHLEDCISKNQFPKLEQNIEDKYLFLLLRFPSLNKIDGKIITNQVCFFLGKNYLVTTHGSENDVIREIFDSCKKDRKQREAFIDGSSSYLLYVLLDHLTADLTTHMQSLVEEVDKTEDIVFDDRISGVYQVGQLRQKIISLRRMVGPLRALVQELIGSLNKNTMEDFAVYFENITNRVERIWETLEAARETVEVYKDADFIFSTEKTNRILALLTIIFTLAIPSTVIGTFYGMNVVLPGGIEAGAWQFWGKYTTFIIILAISAVPALAMGWYFKKKNWF